MELHNEPIAHAILNRLERVHPVIHDVLDKSTTEARNFFEKRKQEVDSNLYSDLVRYYAKELLQQPKYKNIGYILTVLNKNGLLLIYEQDGCVYRIRVRKADEDGELPISGLSKSMKRFIAQRTPLLPGFEDFFQSVEGESEGDRLSTTLLKLVVVWDVDVNYILTDAWLACYKDTTGAKHFAGEIPHSAIAVAAPNTFDEAAEELEDLEFSLEKTGSISE